MNRYIIGYVLLYTVMEIISDFITRLCLWTVGLFLPAVFLVAVGFSGCSGALAVTFLTVSSALGGFSAAGVFINQIDIAPRYKPNAI